MPRTLLALAPRKRAADAARPVTRRTLLSLGALGALLISAALVPASLALPGCLGKKQPKPAGVKLVGNATCPVSGKPVGGSASSPNFHADFRGYRIGFMCPNCKGKFDRAGDAKKLELLNKALKSTGKPALGK